MSQLDPVNRYPVDPLDRVAGMSDMLTQLTRRIEELEAGKPGTPGTPPPPGVAHPDLIVTALTATPASPNPGDAVTFGFTVRNQGNDPVPIGTNVTVNVYVDAVHVSHGTYNGGLAALGGQVTFDTVTSLAAGGTWPATQGTHTVEARVNEAGTIVESNATNNSLSISVTVTAPPAGIADLVVTALSSSSGHQVADSFTRADASVLGTSTSGDAWTAGSGTWGIASNRGRLVTNAGGNQVATVAATADGFLQATFTTMPGTGNPGLVFRYVDAANYWFIVRSPGFATWNVIKRVAGVETFVGNVGSPFAIGDGTIIGVSFVGAAIATFVNGIAGNTFNDGALSTASRVGLFAESTATTDLRIDDFSFAPNPVQGQPVTFTMTILNQGNGAVAGGVNINNNLMIDGVHVSHANYNLGLSPGQSVTIDTVSSVGAGGPWTAVAGTHTAQAIANAAGNVVESNSANNTFNLPVIVGGQASGIDFVVTALSAAPNPATEGNAVTFTVTIQNAGGVAFPAGTILGCGIYIDGLSTPATYMNFNTGLAAGASITLDTVTSLFPGGAWIAIAGTHTIDAFVNDAAGVTETNTANNHRTMTLDVATAPVPGASVTNRGTVNAITAGTTLVSGTFTPAAGSLLIVVTEGTTI